jgi:FtsP/CotA-like multicopper oxidase with cupredoxin domain
MNNDDRLTLQWTEVDLNLPILVDSLTGNRVWQHELNAGDLAIQSRITTTSSIRLKTKTMKLEGAKASIPAPVIYLSRGDNVKIELQNTLRANAVDPSYRINMHTHGLHVAPEEDDSTVSIRPGASHLYDYHLPPNHGGGTHWYHPHINTLGELHVGGGAAGMLIVKDRDDGTEIPPVLMNMPEKLLVIQFIRPQRIITLASGGGRACCSQLDRRTYIKDQLYSMEVDGGITVPDLAFYYLVNGFVQPMLTLVRDKWTRLRIMHTSNGHDVELQVEGATCIVMLVAKDGVYIPSGPRADLPRGSASGNTPFRLTAASRMDIAIRCSAVSSTGLSWITATHHKFDTPDIIRTVPIFQLELEEPTAQVPADTFTSFSFQPCLPSYLPNLLAPEVQVQSHQRYQLEILPYAIDNLGWLGFVAHPNVRTIPLGTVQEWELMSGNHPFHMNINHVMW